MSRNCISKYRAQKRGQIKSISYLYEPIRNNTSVFCHIVKCIMHLLTWVHVSVKLIHHEDDDHNAYEFYPDSISLWLVRLSHDPVSSMADVWVWREVKFANLCQFPRWLRRPYLGALINNIAFICIWSNALLFNSLYRHTSNLWLSILAGHFVTNHWVWYDPTRHHFPK